MFRNAFDHLLDNLESQLDSLESYTHGGEVGVLSIFYDELVAAGVNKKWVNHVIQNCAVSVQVGGVVANGEDFDSIKHQIERFAVIMSKIAAGIINEVEANDWPDEKKDMILRKALCGMSMKIE